MTEGALLELSGVWLRTLREPPKRGSEHVFFPERVTVMDSGTNDFAQQQSF